MQLKILTLNIWGYNGNWKERAINIVKLITKENPDVVFMQEVRDDRRRNKKGNHQGAIINSKVQYPYANTAFVERIVRENKRDVKAKVYEGKLFLSKYPILKSTNIYLKKQIDDKHKRAVQQITLKIEGKKIDFWNIHYSNRDDWSKLHLEETMRLKMNHPTILAGDFNIQIHAGSTFPEFANNTINRTHRNSYNFKKYVSYPGGNVVLDYILIPKRYRFLKVKCTGKKVSDHRAVVATIEID
jgi:endonuclease/exonuclease/phosphatase family metal-dependent hydrolase